MISDLRKETGQNYASWCPSDMFVGLVSPHVFFGLINLQETMVKLPPQLWKMLFRSFPNGNSSASMPAQGTCYHQAFQPWEGQLFSRLGLVKPSIHEIDPTVSSFNFSLGKQAMTTFRWSLSSLSTSGPMSQACARASDCGLRIRRIRCIFALSKPEFFRGYCCYFQQLS